MTRPVLPLLSDRRINVYWTVQIAHSSLCSFTQLLTLPVDRSKFNDLKKKTLRFESQDPVRSFAARKIVFVVELQFSTRIYGHEPSLLKRRFLFPTSLSTRRERFRCLNVDYVIQLEEFNFLVFTHSVLVRVLDVVTSYLHVLYQEQVPGDGLERVVVIIIRLCRSEDRNQTNCCCFLSMPKLPSVTCR